MKEQFRRTALMIGENGLAALHDSCVTVVGLGAVGSYALEALARAGIGRFRLVDFDRVQSSNINRQLLATCRTVGALKTDVARERVASINPAAIVETKSILINDKTVGELFDGDCSSIFGRHVRRLRQIVQVLDLIIQIAQYKLVGLLVT